MIHATSPMAPIASFVQAAKTQRMLFELIADSNGLYDGGGTANWHGWHEGLHAAFFQACGLGDRSWWGTSLWSMNNGRTNEASYQPGYKHGPKSLTLTGISGTGTYNLAAMATEQGGAAADPPAALGNLCRWGGVAAVPTWRPHFYGYLADAAADANSQAGILFDVDCPIGMNEVLVGYTWYGTFLTADGTGSFRPGWREETSNTVLGMSAVIDPVAPNAYGAAVSKVTKEARDHQGRKLWFGPRIPGQGDINGPFFGTYQQVVNPARLTGFSISTMLALGGQSLFDIATAINNTPDETIVHYFNARRQPVIDAGQTPKILFVINSGVNDRNEAGNSINAAGTNASAAGFVDNLGVLVTRLRTLWTAQGWSAADIGFLVLVSHPQQDDPKNTEDDELVSYRLAGATWAATQPCTAVVDLTQVVSGAEMRARDCYAANDLLASRPHLSKAGYEILATKVISQLMAYVPGQALPVVAPSTPAGAMVRDGLRLVVAGDASADTLAPMGFIPVATMELWLADARAGVGTGLVEMGPGDEAEFVFLSPGADGQTGTYLITAIVPTYTAAGGPVPTGYLETRREAGALTNGSMVAGAAGATAVPGVLATDLFVDTLTTTLNKSGTEVDSPVSNVPATLRVRAQGACALRVLTAVGTAAAGFRVIARRCKGDAFPTGV